MTKTKKMLVGLAVTVVVGVATRTVAAAPQPDVVELTVTEKGFDPARVEVSQGHPLNSPVTLTFTPARTGDLTHACAMNMVNGVIHVASRDGADGTSASQGSDAAGPSGM